MNRLLEKPAAAEYIGISEDELRHVPVAPVRLVRNDGKKIRKVLYDKVDLDNYIDSCKGSLCLKDAQEAKEVITENQAEDITEFSTPLKARSTAKQLEPKMRKKLDEYYMNVLRKWNREYP